MSKHKPTDRDIRFVCNWCDKKVKTYVPKGGDGSAKVVMSHKNKRGELCNGSWKLLPWA